MTLSFKRASLSGWLLMVTAFFAATTVAGPEFVNKKNQAIDGYDTVAYFTQSDAVKGKESISAEHNGATWLFASEDNKALFLANPGQYAPAYDGHCAFAAAQGNKVKVDPKAWEIVDGVLYLNYNKKVQNRWLKDVDDFIAQGDANWPELESKPAASPGWF